MPLEVESGSRPGRPALLAVLTAVTLVGALALAWRQTESRRALGPEVRVADTPVHIRPPRGWQVDPRDAHNFVLPVRREGWRRQQLSHERRIRITYERRESFLPVETWLEAVRGNGGGRAPAAQPARLGRFPAVETRLLVPKRLGHKRFYGEVLVRAALLPRGDVILVEYDPLVDLRPTDYAILDDVCATLRVDDPALTVSREEALARAGLAFPIAPRWTVTGPAFPEVPGVFVGGLSDGLPAWALGVFRTCRAYGRTLEALLADFAWDRWMQPEAESDIRSQTRARGGALAYIRQPRAVRGSDNVVAVYAVATSDSDAALIFAYAGPDFAAAAEDAAAELAGALEFRAHPGAFDYERAIADGARLVARLNERGAVPRWGREAVEHVYDGFAPGVTLLLRIQRAALGRDAEQGYRGWELLESSRRQEQHTRWELDGRAQGYESRTEFWRANTRVTIEERREGAAPRVHRSTRIADARPESATFRVGPAFVPPPAESIIEGWAARGDAPAVVVEYSSLAARGACAVLLRALPPAEDRPRVLVQFDYRPFGILVTFDDAVGEPASIDWGAALLRRVPSSPQPR